MPEQNEVTLTQVLNGSNVNSLLRDSALQILFGDACSDLGSFLTKHAIQSDEALGNQNVLETIELCQNGKALITLVVGEHNAAVVRHDLPRGYITQPRSLTSKTEFSFHTYTQEALNDFVCQLLILRAEELAHRNFHLTTKPRKVRIDDLTRINSQIRLRKSEEDNDANAKVVKTNLVNLFSKHGAGLPKDLIIFGNQANPHLVICVFSKFSALISQNSEIKNKLYTHLEALRILIQALKTKER
jgi:hypothetical protein